MTVQEMHYDFKFKFDKVDSLDKPNFTPAEIDWILNEAQNLVLKTKYSGNNAQRTGFEVSQKRIDDLKTLHIKSPTQQQPGLVPVQSVGDLYEVKLSGLAFPYFVLTRGRALVTKDGCGSKVISLESTQTDDLNDVEGSPFSKPSYQWGELPITFGRSDSAANDDGSIYFDTQGEFTVDEVYLDYLKLPSKIYLGTYTYIDGTTPVQSACELPEAVHSEVVDRAVAEVSRIVEDARFVQFRTDKLNFNE